LTSSSHVHLHRHSQVQTYWHTTPAPACPKAQISSQTTDESAELKYSCHQCKCKKVASSFTYLTCTGIDNKFAKPCRKKFCTGCLSKHYPDCMNESPSKWKCPSCLNRCICAACLRTNENNNPRSGKRNKKFSCHQCKLSKKVDDLVFCTRRGDGKKTRDCRKKNIVQPV